MGTGTNFAVFSHGATKVELCLFDAVDGSGESQKVELVEKADEVWHVFLPMCARASFTVTGSTVLGNRKRARFNPAKVLLDPYSAPSPAK